MRIGRYWVFGCWLVMLAAAIMGGWNFGRAGLAGKTPTAGEARRLKAQQSESVLAADSPKGQWAERVKKAAPADFPKLLEDWRSLFPATEAGIEGQPEHALRWLMAQWLVHDPDGFPKAIQATGWGTPIEVLARLKPDFAADLLNGKGGIRLEEFQTNNLASELAKWWSDLYLKLNSDGARDFTPDDHCSDDDWETAIGLLAKTDPTAAADAWKRRKLENNHDQVLQALLPVFEAWREGDIPIKDWVEQVEDPEVRDIARHAYLMAMARNNPHKALAELYETPLQGHNNLRDDAPGEILTQLVKQDLPAALRLLKETSPLFHSSDIFSDEPSGSGEATTEIGDPFADPPVEPPAPPVVHSKPLPNPFIALNHRADNTAEDNWMRSLIVRKAAENLPENPEELIAALRQLRSQMGGDSPWQRKIEAELVRNASERLSADSCLALAGLWNAEMGGKRDDETFQSLADRAAAASPELAETALDSLPEAARASFAAAIVKKFPAEERERRLRLLERLTPVQWDASLGESLGENASDYADAIARLPGGTTSGAREAFVEKWVENDPEAAARWLTVLPQDEAAGSAALGLFKGWTKFDPSAAIAWATNLPEGPVRQAVALEVVGVLGAAKPREAWRWAASISDPKVRAWAYNTISVDRDDEPETFQQEHEAVLRAAGMK